MTLKALYLFFGCRVNQVELQSIEETLECAGILRASRNDIPDICIINSCSVTATAESKARRKIRSLNREYPNMRIYILGCYATRASKQLMGLPGVVKVFPNIRKNEIIDEITALESSTCWSPITSSGIHNRACIKIQDGCPGQCTYCVVRCLRGKPVSRDKHEVVAEIASLCEQNVPEVILTGINLASWGMEKGKDFSELLLHIARSNPSCRVRISSVELAFLSRAVIDVLAQYPQVYCPHLHVPLQSGSDRVLAHMKRNYTSAEFLNTLDFIKTSIPGIGLTTDVIVGYPTESDEDFANTAEVCKQAGFHRIHGFSYSPRPGTESYKLGDRISGDAKKARIVELSAVAKANLVQYVDSLSGKPLEVVFDGRLLPASQREGYSAEYLRILSGSFSVPGCSLVTVREYEAMPPNVIMKASIQSLQ